MGGLKEVGTNLFFLCYCRDQRISVVFLRIRLDVTFLFNSPRICFQKQSICQGDEMGGEDLYDVCYPCYRGPCRSVDFLYKVLDTLHGRWKNTYIVLVRIYGLCVEASLTFLLTRFDMLADPDIAV